MVTQVSQTSGIPEDTLHWTPNVVGVSGFLVR
jgi:hypothetical protein